MSSDERRLPTSGLALTAVQAPAVASEAQPDALGWLTTALATRWRGPVPQPNSANSGDSGAFWQQVAELAKAHSVAPLLYRQVQVRAVAVPRAISLWLAAMHGQMTWQMAQVRPAVSEVLQAFGQAGVPYLVLKGWGLLPLLYEDDLAQRPSGDLDLYVPPDQRSGALDVLRRLGYQQYEPVPWPGFALRYDASVKLERSPQTPQHPIVDLHWQFAAAPCYWRRLGHNWLQRCQTLTSDDVAVPVPDATDLLLYLCVHMAINHHAERGLLRYHDLALLIHQAQTGLDWDSLIDQTNVAGVSLYVRSVIAHLHSFWPHTVPENVVQRLAALPVDRQARWLYSWQVVQRHDAWSGLMLKLATLPGAGRKARYLLESAFPSASYLRNRYGLSSSSPWFTAYARRFAIAWGQALAHIRQAGHSD